jgi:very-short-patch-repair endonuclease
VLRQGVYADAEACPAVITAARHGGSLACVSAARHLGLWVLDDTATIHVWLAHGHRYEHRDCRCVDHWDASEGRDAFGIPSIRTILRQILACRGVEDFVVALESALRRGLITRTDRDWLRRKTGPTGRAAVGWARSDADSGLETLLRWRLRHHGLDVRSQVAIFGVGRVDFVVGDRLLVEVDGRMNHDDEPHRHKDLVRDANAAVWGYTTLRFDYAMVVHDWPLVEAAILGALAARGASGVHIRG